MKFYHSRGLLILLIPVLFLGLFTSAQAGSKKELINKRRNDVGRIKKELDQKEKFIRKLKRKETSILSVIEKLDSNIKNQNKKVEEINREKSTVLTEFGRIKSDISDLQNEMEIKKKDICARLRSSYKMGRFGFLKILLASNDYYDFQKKRYYLEALLKSEEEMFDSYTKSETDLNKNLALSKEKGEKLAALSREVRQKLVGIKNDRHERVAVLRAVKSEKALEVKKVKELERAARDLEAMIRKIAKGAGEKGKGAFALHKGTLNMPVDGKIGRGFGGYVDRQLNLRMRSKGLSMQIDRPTIARSIFDGKVIYSSFFRGYGNMVIIDHGDNYYSLYARLDSLEKKVGDVVKKNERVGTVGGNDSIHSYGFYFELRHNGVPINPLPWFATGAGRQ